MFYPVQRQKLKKTSVELEEIKNTLATFEKKEAIADHLCILIVNDDVSPVAKLNFIVNLCSLVKSNALHLALESKEEMLPPLTSNNNAQKEVLPKEIISPTKVQQKKSTIYYEKEMILFALI